jgi:hypothetical protein
MRLQPREESVRSGTEKFRRGIRFYPRLSAFISDYPWQKSRGVEK